MQTKDIVARYGLRDRTVRRINEAGEKYGEAPPWEKGPSAMVDWHLRNGRPHPDWLTDALMRETRPAVARTAAPGPVENDSGKVMESILDAIGAGIRDDQASGSLVAAGKLARDYANFPANSWP